MPFLGKLDQNGTETYCFKTSKCLAAIEELSGFESDLVLMIKNIQFRPVRNNFPAKLKNCIKEINNTDGLLVNADKSTNNYKFSKDQYKKHFCDNVTLRKLIQNVIGIKSIASIVMHKISVKK